MLRRHCIDLELGGLVTKADVELALGQAWVCVQQHNEDKDVIDAQRNTTPASGRDTPTN